MNTWTINLQVFEGSGISGRFGYISKQAIYVYGYPLLIHDPIANLLYLLL